MLLIFSCISETSEMFTLFINKIVSPEEKILFILRIFLNTQLKPERDNQYKLFTSRGTMTQIFVLSVKRLRTCERDPLSNLTVW